MNIIVVVLGIVSIVLLAVFLLSVLYIVNMEETKSSEFYGKELVNPNSPTWFSSFDRFKRLVLRFAERDEEIKYYIRYRKNRHDAIHANISYSNVDREADGKNVSSEL